ncbi:MAG: hypothetical protein LW805_12155 [Oxalobacteraceae bacterium]|nr:hypothetical protein [Oxalobacteraceae bacterium]
MALDLGSDVVPRETLNKSTFYVDAALLYDAVISKIKRLVSLTRPKMLLSLFT